MTKNEKTMLLGFMSELSERFGNDGCNDYTLPNTPENVEFVRAAETWSDPTEEFEPPDPGDDKIWTSNGVILDYLAHKLEHESEA